MMDLGKTNYQRGDFYKSEEKQLLESNATRLEVPDGHLVKNNIGGVDFIPSNLANGGGETIVGPARNSHAGVGIALRNAGYGDYANAPDSAAYRVAKRGGVVNSLTIGEEQMRIAKEKEDNKSGFEKLLDGVGSLGIPIISSAASGLSQIAGMGDCDSFGDCAGRVLGGLGTIGAGVATVIPEVAPFAAAAGIGASLAGGNVAGAATMFGQRVMGGVRNVAGDFASTARGYAASATSSVRTAASDFASTARQFTRRDVMPARGGSSMMSSVGESPNVTPYQPGVVPQYRGPDSPVLDVTGRAVPAPPTF
jgi:hypothetical protein